VNKKAYLFFLVLFTFSLASVAQLEQNLLPIKLNGKSGLINRQGDIVIKPRYDAIETRFEEGYALVRIEDRTGVVDISGAEIIPVQYDHIKFLGDDYFGVYNQGLAGVIDKNNTQIIPIKYEELRYLSNNLFVGHIDTMCGLINAENRLILPFEFSNIFLIENTFLLTYKNEYKGLYNLNGKCVLETKYAEIDIVDSSTILYSFDLHKWGAVTNNGDELLELVWRNYIKFPDFIGLKRQGKWAVYSKAIGKVITESKYDTLIQFYPLTSYLVCISNSLCGIVNDVLSEIISPQYENIINKPPIGFQLNYLGKIGLADYSGKVLFDPIYDNIICSELNDRIVMLAQNGKYGLSLLDGTELLQITSNRIELSENKAKVFKNGALTIVDFNPEGRIIEQTTFENVNTISVNQDYIEVGNRPTRRNSLEGVLSPRSYGWYRKGYNSKWGLKDTMGEIIKNPIYTDVVIDTILGASIVSLDIPGKFDGFSFLGEKIKVSRQMGIYDHKNYKYLIKPRIWDIRISDFNQGRSIARIITPSNDYFGYVSKSGRVYTKNITYFGDFQEGLAKICYNGILKHAEEMYIDKTAKISKEICDTVYYRHYYHNRYRNFSGPWLLSKTDNFWGDRMYAYNPLPLYVHEGQWGFISEKGDMQIPLDYSFVNDFKHNSSIVKKGNYWGVINSSNDKIVDFKYDYISRLPNANDSFFCLIKDNAKYGIINKNGQLVKNASFSSIGNFSEDIAKVRIGKKWGFINSNGELIIPAKYDNARDFHEGLAAVKIGRKWGFINSSGKIVIETKYRSTGDFASGLAKVFERSKCGYINKSGRYKIDPKYYGGSDVISGCIIAKKNGRMGIIDKHGKWIVGPHYSSIEPILNTDFFLLKAKRDYGVVNSKGKKIVAVKYDFIGPFVNGIAVAKKNRDYGYIDTLGKEVIPFKYTGAQEFSEGLAGVRVKTKWGYINRKGDMFLAPVYNKVSPFHEARAVVNVKRLEGVIDRNGLFIVNPNFHSIGQFVQNRAITKKYSELQFIDTNANVLFNYQRFWYADTFINGNAIVGKKARFGLIDYHGNYTCTIKYSKLHSIGNGLYAFVKPTYSGLADINGKVLLEPVYELIEYFEDGIFRVELDNKIGYYAINKGWIWNPSQ